MKKFYLPISSAVLFFIYAFSIQAQTTGIRLNQVDLMKQWIGKWKTEGAYVTSEIKPFGNDALEGYQKNIVNDSVLSEHKFIYGYDKKSDKYISAAVSKNSSGVMLMAFFFTSENTCERIPVENISNPELAESKAIYEFKTKDSIKATFMEKGKPDRTYNVIRIKK